MRLIGVDEVDIALFECRLLILHGEESLVGREHTHKFKGIVGVKGPVRDAVYKQLYVADLFISDQFQRVIHGHFPPNVCF